MNKSNIKIIVFGAGISGLSTAFWLNKKGYSVTVLESKRRVGGAMETEKANDYLIDYGSNSGLLTTPLISQLAEEVGLKEELIFADESAEKRYILKNSQLHALPTAPKAFLKTKLFSGKAKLRLLKEPFISRSGDGYFQSIAEFVERRLGKEFLEYAIDPFVSGVFAGDPYKLSVGSAFPKLYRLEEKYGGIFKGVIFGARERKKRNEESKQSAKMFSFKNGMQSFPQAIYEKLKDKVKLNAIVEEVTKTETGYNVVYSEQDVRQEIEGDIILSTVPSYEAANIFNKIDHSTQSSFNEIYYPPVLNLYLSFKKENIGKELDGFGFLIPSKEKRTFLGAIWSSTIFPGRCGDNYASFTIFIGGARNPHLFEMDKNDLINKVVSEFNQVMNVKGEPEFVKTKLWEKAIPQYNLGYVTLENKFKDFEKNNPGIFLSGNFIGGISVGDCVKNSEVNLNRINKYIEEKFINKFSVK